MRAADSEMSLSFSTRTHPTNNDRRRARVAASQISGQVPVRVLVLAGGTALCLFAVLVSVFLLRTGDPAESVDLAASTGQGAGDAPTATNEVAAGLLGSAQSKLRHDHRPRPSATEASNSKPDRKQPASDVPADHSPSKKTLAEDASLTIQVVDGSQEPLAAVRVVLVQGRSTEGKSEVTDHEGFVSFNDLAPGRYTFRIEAEAAALPSKNLVSADAVTLSESEDRDLLVTVGSFDRSISGRVLDSSGKPVAGIVIHAKKHTLRASEGAVVLADQGALAAESDEDGEYEIVGLRPGRVRDFHGGDCSVPGSAESRPRGRGIGRPPRRGSPGARGLRSGDFRRWRSRRGGLDRRRHETLADRRGGAVLSRARTQRTRHHLRR